MGRLRLFGELIEAGGAIEGGGGRRPAAVTRWGASFGRRATTRPRATPSSTSTRRTSPLASPPAIAGYCLLLAGSVYVSGMRYAQFDFTIDGQRQGTTKGVQQVQAVYAEDIQIGWLAQVPAGSHVFRPQWRVSAGSGLLRASSAETPAMFAVVELKVGVRRATKDKQAGPPRSIDGGDTSASRTVAVAGA